MVEVKLEGKVAEYSGDSFEEISSMFSSDLDRIEDEMLFFGFTEEDVFAVRLCCEELLTNAYKHGNNKNPKIGIRFEYKILGRNFPFDLLVYGFFGSIRDNGNGFDPNKIRNPLLDENLDIPNGRGILLVESYSDFVEFRNNGDFIADFIRYKQKGL
ncbi:ATP-binding protein [Candidatus Woesearchaeota archaeon]|nr:ATP-binding protein [Candidatus Woesearchaeota archaeon]